MDQAQNQQPQATQITPEQLESTALDLINRRGDQLDDVARDNLKNQVVEELTDAINKAFIDALPKDQLEQMVALSEQADPSEDEFNRIISEAHLDNAALIRSALTTYSQKFLARA